MTAHLSNPSPILVAAIVAIFALGAVTAWRGWRW